MGSKDHDATMMISASMILPLLGPPPPPKPGKPAPSNDATMVFTPDMVVNEASVVMGRPQIERALAVVGLWHVAVNTNNVATLLATTTDDVERIHARGTTRGRQALADWFARAGFSAIPTRWFCGGEGHVVVEARARWRERDGELQGVIASAFIVRDGRIERFEWFDELQSALTVYGLRDVHEVVRRRVP